MIDATILLYSIYGGVLMRSKRISAERQKGCVDLPASTGRSYSAPESQEVVRVDLHDTDNFPMNSSYIGFRHLRK